MCSTGAMCVASSRQPCSPPRTVNGDIKLVRLLLQEMEAYNNNNPSVGKLQNSYPRGSWERRQYALTKCLNRKDAGNNTPLMLACKHGYAHSCRFSHSTSLPARHPCAIVLHQACRGCAIPTTARCRPLLPGQGTGLQLLATGSVPSPPERAAGVGRSINHCGVQWSDRAPDNCQGAVHRRYMSLYRQSCGYWNDSHASCSADRASRCSVVVVAAQGIHGGAHGGSRNTGRHQYRHWCHAIAFGCQVWEHDHLASHVAGMLCTRSCATPQDDHTLQPTPSSS